MHVLVNRVLELLTVSLIRELVTDVCNVCMSCVGQHQSTTFQPFQPLLFSRCRLVRQDSTLEFKSTGLSNVTFKTKVDEEEQSASYGQVILHIT